MCRVDIWRNGDAMSVSSHDYRVTLRKTFFAGTAITALALLSACGGSGGRGPIVSTPTPVPAPAPAPAPTPPPTNFDTAELRRSDGPGFHGAVTAYSAGATGRGVTIGIVDSGIDRDSPEFAGRIDPLSADFAGNGDFNDVDGHGTQVALIAAAAKNNVGVHGIAYNATILALRADDQTNCTDMERDSDGCGYSSTAIAAGIDRAILANARVINLSLGGKGTAFSVRQAINRATSAGIVVIVSAGNEGDVNDDPEVDPSNPNRFAAGVQASGNGLVIIAGSVNEDRMISGFSNRAGSLASFYLTALGNRICCVYKDGELLVETDAQGRQLVSVVSGTSFSAPQISGAVALLAQAFPNLTGRQIVDLLLSTGDDAGAAGVDNIYGQGILNIARAFNPRGATSLAGTSVSVALSNATGTTSGPMGDAGQTRQSIETVILDSYARAYSVDLGNSLTSAPIENKLTPALAGGMRTMNALRGTSRIALTIAPDNDGSASSTPMSLSIGDARQAQVLAGSVVTQFSAKTAIGFGISRGADGLVASLQGKDEPASLIAQAPRSNFGFAKSSDNALAIRHQISDIGMTANMERGDALIRGYAAFDPAQYRPQRYRYTSSGIAFDKSWGGVKGSLGLTILDERETVLGGKFNAAFGGQGATTVFVDADGRFDLGHDWQAGAMWRQGFTRPRSGGALANGSQLVSTAFAFDIGRANIWAAGDSVFFRFSQPLRVSSGGLNLNLPSSYNYYSMQTDFSIQRFNLAPSGRELVSEIGYGRNIWGGALSANIFYRTDPGHYQSLSDDKGAAMRFTRQF